MPTLAAGSDMTPCVGLACCPSRNAHERRMPPRRLAPLNGFTLLELLLVVAIVAMASVGVSLAMRDSAQARLETDAQRLVAILESARAQSRASGLPVHWRATGSGFVLEGLPSDTKDALPQAWLEPGVAASSTQPLLLGPEPLIPPQSVQLWLREQPQKRIRIASDGVRPFAIQDAAP
jgi:general secretion pathway protein H